jgi:hypothetical protein
MSMTPERVAERVVGMVECILSSGSRCFSEHNAHESIYHIAQVYETGVINYAPCVELESDVHEASRSWRAPLNNLWDRGSFL